MFTNGIYGSSNQDMSSFKSTDIPYSQLCHSADQNEFLDALNQCHLNELDVSGGYDLQNSNLLHAQSIPASLITTQSPHKDSQYHGHNYNQIMYQTIPQQTPDEHQMQTDDSALSQSYLPLNHYQTYPRNYELNKEPDQYLYHPQSYPQQPMQSQFYHHINQSNFFNESLNRCELIFLCVCVCNIDEFVFLCFSGIHEDPTIFQQIVF